MNEDLREAAPQSEHSPGVVHDDETLLRMGYSPEHILDGEVLVAAIRSDDLSDLRRGGFSVDRQTYVFDSILRDRAGLQMERAPTTRNKAFISVMIAGKLRREATADGDRAFLVLDTATADNLAHASVASATKRSRAQIKELKDILARHLLNKFEIDAYFMNRPG